ncbi:MAG: hypothetical protein J6R25_00715 [Bacteroidales bacterium]|nr:hypothetical protein [Bacteroidales bacterium]
MGVLGELWVKLGLKNEEFKAGIDEAKGKTETFGEDVKKVSTAVKAAWAAVGAAVIKLGTDMVKQTQVIGDKWGVFTAGLTAAYNEFVSRIGSGAGWDNLIADMREASRVAKEVQMSLDELFERNNSLSIQEAKKQTEIEKYKQQMRDVSLTDEQRIAAGERAMALEQELLQMRKDVAKQEADAYKQILQQRTKMTDADLEYFLENYNGNREQIQQAIAYRDTLASLNREIENARVFESQSTGEARRGWKEKAELLEQNRAELTATTNEELKAIADLATKYDLGNDEMVQNYVNALVKMENAGAQYYRETTRMVTMLSSLKQGMGTTGGTAVATAGREALAPLSPLQGLSMPGVSTEGVDHIAETAKHIRKQKDVALAELEDFNRRMEESVMETAMYSDMFNNAIVSGVVDSLSYLAESIAEGEEINAGAMVAALLTPLADMAISAGTLVLSTGVAVEGVKDALTSLNPYVAIAAGAALVAIGVAAKAGLGAIAKNGGSKSQSYSFAGGGSMGGAYGVDMTTQSQTQEVQVTGVIKGQDIYLANENYKKNKRR